MQTIKVSQGGRVVIPAELREQLNIQLGDELIVEARDGELVLISKRHRLRKIQEEVAAYLTLEPGRSLVDELFDQRRTEVAKEETETQEMLNAIRKRDS